MDTVPLQLAATNPTPSLVRTVSDGGQEARLDDPFANPVELLSPFADSYQIATTAIPDAQLQDDELTRNPSMHHPPRPKPLDLPQPKTPPPMDPTSSPSLDIHEERHEGVEPRNVRWWHDWLCGCGEGPDRGGDYQVSFCAVLLQRYFNIESIERLVAQILLNDHKILLLDLITGP